MVKICGWKNNSHEDQKLGELGEQDIQVLENP